MDFTVTKYKQLLSALKAGNYIFQPYADFIESPAERAIILRHDVDGKKMNSLLFARMQTEAGLNGTYYFRVAPKSYDEDVISEIASLGHEIGYHYETMDTAHGDVDEAYDVFCRNLEMFRELVPIKTICMHGSPLSKHDNRDLWKKYDYKTLGIIAEPYFDIDFKKVLYLTDTGRRWDGEKVSVRDKVNKEHGIWNMEHGSEVKSLKFHSTDDIIQAAKTGKLPDKIMLTFHPQRWNDKPIPWVKELVFQNAKNIVKRMIVK
ncbi:MAG: hypothetical protein ABFS05_09410 [Bacteroidota bacterium]